VEFVASSGDGSTLLLGQIGSTNFGANWFRINLSYNAGGAVGVAVSADGKTMDILTSLGNFVSTDCGATWSSNASPGAVPINGGFAMSADSRKLFACVGSALIYVSTNLGVSWTKTGALLGDWSSVACSADGTHVIAASPAFPSGAVFTSSDGGTTWQTNNVPSDLWQYVQISADGGTCFAASSSQIWISRSALSPTLVGSNQGTGLALSWLLPSTNFILQQSSDLGTPNWSTVTDWVVFNPATLQEQVFISPTNSGSFFRLRTP
jgi:hypothetical protein